MKDTRRNRRLAYERRMGIVGDLQSCICLWPLVEYDTLSKHHEACPTQSMSLGVFDARVVTVRFKGIATEAIASEIATREVAASSRPLKKKRRKPRRETRRRRSKR